MPRLKPPIAFFFSLLVSLLVHSLVAKAAETPPAGFCSKGGGRFLAAPAKGGADSRPINWVIAFGYDQFSDSKKYFAADPIAYEETFELLNKVGFRPDLAKSSLEAPHRKMVVTKFISIPGTTRTERLDITLLYSALSPSGEYNRLNAKLQTAQSKFVFSEIKRLRDEEGAPLAIMAGHAGNGDGMQRGPLPYPKSIKWLGQKVDSVLPWGNRAQFLKSLNGQKGAAPLQEVIFLGCRTDQHYRNAFAPGLPGSKQTLVNQYLDTNVSARDRNGTLLIQSLVAKPIVESIQRLIRGESAEAVGASMRLEINGAPESAPGQAIAVTPRTRQ